MNDFHEGLRYEYDLNPDSVVVDGGAYLGNFSRAIGQRYDCRIIGFEPVPQFFVKAVVGQCDKTRILPVGLSDELRFAKFGVQNDSTGEFAGSEQTELVVLIPVDYILRELVEKQDISLFKLNIEGGEYDVMERILKTEMQKRIVNLQIQWHAVALNATERMVAIRHELSKTHALTFSNGFVWENWQRQ